MTALAYIALAANIIACAYQIANDYYGFFHPATRWIAIVIAWGLYMGATFTPVDQAHLFLGVVVLSAGSILVSLSVIGALTGQTIPAVFRRVMDSR
jgi:hypothetical protein